MNEWMGGWMDGWMDRWIDRCTCTLCHVQQAYTMYIEMV